MSRTRRGPGASPGFVVPRPARFGRTGPPKPSCRTRGRHRQRWCAGRRSARTHPLPRAFPWPRPASGAHPPVSQRTASPTRPPPPRSSPRRHATRSGLARTARTSQCEPMRGRAVLAARGCTPRAFSSRQATHPRRHLPGPSARSCRPKAYRSARRRLGAAMSSCRWLLLQEVGLSPLRRKSRPQPSRRGIGRAGHVRPDGGRPQQRHMRAQLRPPRAKKPRQWPGWPSDRPGPDR